MDFRFSFLPETDAEPVEVSDNKSESYSVESKDELCGVNAVELYVNKGVPEDYNSESYTQLTTPDGFVIKYITPPEKYTMLGGVNQQTDLIPGQYEGGAKTWECSFILLDYLVECLGESMELKGKSILESYRIPPDRELSLTCLLLGCGSALPGIYCSLKGASVIFQDYNKEVIEDITIPNVRLSHGVLPTGNYRFFSGDWSKLIPLLSENRFDLILASEVIYNTNSYSKLHNVFVNCLSDTGVVYLASKQHYFGVGGGVDSFRDYIENQHALAIEDVYTTEHNLKCVIQKITKMNTG